MRPMIKFVKEYSNGSLIGCEVGVWYGDNALSILENLDIKMLYLVDPYKAHRIYTGRLFRQEKMDEIKLACEKKLYGYKDKCVFVPLNSKHASKLYAECYFAFIYLDPQHDYRNAKRDIKLWYSKVKPNGVFGGHDYNPGITDGVIKAVDEFVKIFGLELYQDEMDWWVVKPSSYEGLGMED